jgi:hypothetical protein
MNKQIQHILLQLPDAKMKLALAIRELILAHDTSMEELIKYGRITFTYQNKDLAFLCIKSTHAHIELGFFDGVSLVDTNSQLKGTAKTIRRMEVHEMNDEVIHQIVLYLSQLIEK